MNISYNWLKDYSDINLSPDEISGILTGIGLEVEAIENFEPVRGGLRGFIVGEVISKEKHPDADKLCVTKVDVGEKEYLNIVCGAPNVEKGQKVVVAPIGTTVFSGDKPVKIKRSKIRGVDSEGMICAEDELGMGTSHDGIIVLDGKAKTGTFVRDYFGMEEDVIFTIGLTPNRIDAASHFGVARDIAAYLRQHQLVALNMPCIDTFSIANHSFPVNIVIEDNEACIRYSGITISDVKVSESPDWLKNRLKSIGLTPINNVVDITNFVLHEIGQPLHAFNADKISDKTVIVKKLPEGTTFVTLDGIQRKLCSNDLMICDSREAMCMAGVYGGLGSGVDKDTKNIFLESACFDPVHVRKTTKHHGLNTDASFRFERGTDPNITIWALQRAAILIRDIAGGTISSEIVDVYPKPVRDFTVELTYSNVDRLIGKQIDKEVIKDILKSLDIKIAAQKEKGLLLDVPPYRVDVRRECDVIEEILRIYGYNNVDTDEKVKSCLSYSAHPDREKVCNLISDFLSSNGYCEMMCNSLTNSEYYNHHPEFKNTGVFMLNPLSKELDCMRQTLLYGGLETIAYNINRKNQDLKLYEFGKCYRYKGKPGQPSMQSEYNETEHLALFVTGKKHSVNWISADEKSDFYHLKTFAENVLLRIGIQGDAIEKASLVSDVFDEGLGLKTGNKLLAEIGRVNKKVSDRFGIKQEVYFADIIWSTVLATLKKSVISAVELPKFPAVKRDLALILDRKISFDQLYKLAYQTEKKLLRNVSLFDVFEDENILGKDKKSYAVSFILLDENKTLTDVQIEKIMAALIKVYTEELGAKLR